MNNSYTHKFFYASLYATFFVPLILYVFIWLANVFRSYNPNLNKNVSDTNKHNNIDSSKHLQITVKILLIKTVILQTLTIQRF